MAHFNMLQVYQENQKRMSDDWTHMRTRKRRNWSILVVVAFVVGVVVGLLLK